MYAGRVPAYSFHAQIHDAERSGYPRPRHFEQEEEERVYADFAYALREKYPDNVNIFTDMVHEENEHRRDLIDLYVERFGQHIPLIRRQDIAGVMVQRPVWLLQSLGIEAVRRHACQMETDAARFYRQAAWRTDDAATQIAG